MRIRACGLILRDCKVLLQRKAHEAIWALPGGRVEAGETPEVAVVREFMEELGWAVQVGRQRWIIENSFQHDGSHVRQTEICWDISCAAPLTVKDRSLVFQWISASELAELDFRPTAVRQRLFEH